METNQSVARALQILEELARAPEPLGIREIARSIDVAPSIAQRLVATLMQSGFAEQTAERRYAIGARAYVLGNAHLAGNALVRESLPELQALAQEHRFNSYLGVARGASMVYLLACQSSGPIAINVRAGETAPLHSTALGKALLAGMAPEDAKKLLGREPYARVTPKTLTRWAALQPQLARARSAGYSVAAEENLLGIFAIGAPVMDASGRIAGAISGALPLHEAPAARQPALARRIVEAAQRISRRLGAPAHRRAA
jgi:IclR family KDG regulon transcriptional repressor